MKTTLNKIRKHGPCQDGWSKLLKHLGKTQADDEPLKLTTIIESNGLDDALWCLRAVDGHDREIQLYAAWCARQVQHLLKDKYSIEALDVAERYANGDATEEERAAVWAAVWDTARAAAAAAWAAVWAAAEDARAAVWAAAEDAAEDARAAAEAAAREAQEQKLIEICKENA